MRYFGMHDQKTCKNFLIAHKAGQENTADYFAKNHYEKHHIGYVLSIYIQKKATVSLAHLT